VGTVIGADLAGMGFGELSDWSALLSVPLFPVYGVAAVALAGARNKAAALLGVAPDASAEAIETALQEKLARYTPEKLHGLAPEFMRQAATQREALQRAAELLRQSP